jgi:N-carbamoyl-L-amino-acid hydrolase
MLAMGTEPRIDGARIARRIEELGQVGSLGGRGVCRLALTDADRLGRDRVVAWMRELGLAVTIDRIGNVVGVRAGREDLPPVMMGSHVDTVRTGGRYDGNLGVLGGLEVVAALNDAGVTTRRPVAVAFFTNEEGARFQPDMMGSLVFAGALPLEAALATKGIDGTTVGEDLARIGYAGPVPVGAPRVHAYVELHVEQGPVLEAEGFTIGAVEGVQGISWTELTLRGQSNHAGTTPMSHRHDAGYAAAEIAVFARRLARELGGRGSRRPSGGSSRSPTRSRPPRASRSRAARSRGSRRSRSRPSSWPASRPSRASRGTACGGSRAAPATTRRSSPPSARPA